MWQPKITHVRPGQRFSADDFNDVADRLEKMHNLRVEQGSALEVDSGPWGHDLTIRPTNDLWAQLSGSSSPYSWQEVAADTAGAWVSYGNMAGTGNAYEINAKAGLSGKVVQLAYTAAGDWRFAYEGVGTVACNPTTTKFNITVYGCFGSPNVLPGATVTVSKSGTVVASGTTDGSGQYSLGITSPGPYTYTVTYPGLSTVISSGWTAFCGSSVTTTASFAPPGGGPICCCNTRDYPRTLFLTTSAGTATLTWNSGLSSWIGSQTVNVLSYINPGSSVCVCDGSPAASHPIVVSIGAGCRPSGGISISWAATDCPPGSDANWLPLLNLVACSTGDETLGSGATWVDPCAGLPQTFTLPATVPAGVSGTCPCPISGTVILSQ